MVLGLFRAAPASAEPTTQEKALGSRLFDDASKLMASGQTAAACPKYAESERLDPELGTLLHLGECYAKINKTASAWASFKEAGDIAAQRGDARAPKIRERLAALEKNLSNLVIAVADSEPPALEVRQDGVVVGKAGWGTPIPVDPGEHKISATAPGAKAREVTLTVPEKPQTVTVSLPPIEMLPAEAPATAGGTTPLVTPSTGPANVAADQSGSWFSTHQRALGLVVGGVGVVGIGVGSAFGLMAKSTYDKSDPHCNGDHCDSSGHDFRESALGKATVSDVAFGVGGAALIGGAVLFLTAPKQSAQTAIITPIVGPNLALVSVRRSF
jgi:hypothetical protein